MSPDVLARKLRHLARYVDDLRAVQVAADILSHLLAEQKVTPDSYRGTFQLAVRHDLVPRDLGTRLADAAGLRNILVHMYEEIDYEIVADSIEPALEDFGRLADHLRATLGG